MQWSPLWSHVVRPLRAQLQPILSDTMPCKNGTAAPIAPHSTATECPAGVEALSGKEPVT